ncbi:hypothetical protein GIB67_014164 [Kingdonia uniflora]|uniref:BRCT domain-containing protein n=1 Tax=Kingdonia uniflora TaxID=39325 RepID=A0A7J7NCY1_9MAGN|nr:hypothetical protein GIB67_014164 [Kingdonia uniflora]
MQEVEEEEDLPYPSRIFLGIRFFLHGFVPLQESEVRSKLVAGGGVDVGKYGPVCTHIIVDKILYDDSVCVAARSDGKTVITALWVDYSLDVGMTFDPSLVRFLLCS